MRDSIREHGQGLVEYALILLFIAAVVFFSLQLLGPTLSYAYAKVIGGFDGQSLTGTGLEFVVTDVQKTVAGGPPSCTVNITSVEVIAVQDGQLLTNTAINVPVSIAGGGSSSVSGTTNRNGVATTGGTSVTGPCPGTLNIASWSQRIP